MSAPKADRDRIFESWVDRLAKIVKELQDAYLHQAIWTDESCPGEDSSS